MAEATTAAASSSKAKAKSAGATFETPKIEFPKFEMPRADVPAAFREFAEKGVVQAKDTYEKFRSAAEESTVILEDTYANTAKGVTAYNLKVIEAARANANAAFDFASEFIGVKSLSEAVELSATHARKQFEAFSEQTRELTELAQRVASDAAEPMKNGLNKAFKKVA